MNIKEQLQFLAMMIPTFLLLGAAALTLAFPTKSMGEPAVIVAAIPDLAEGERSAAEDSDIGAVRSGQIRSNHQITVKLGSAPGY